MIPRYLTIALTNIFCLTIFPCCDQSQNIRDTPTEKSVQNIQPDTFKTAIIPFDQTNNYLFDKSYKPASLRKEDLQIIDSLLVVCVSDYNNSLNKNDKKYSIDLKKFDYRKQIIAVTNKKGNKEVWVNCICNTLGSDKWKTEVMQVEDGGNCFFNFKINLTTKKIYNLIVNGWA